MLPARYARYLIATVTSTALLAACSNGLRGTPLLHYGTVFSIARSGKEKVLHSFGSGSDGAYPTASLIEVGGTLYGTTFEGGTNEYGTIFSITKSGTETVLHSFAGGSDGAYPSASLIDVGGTLYGTTENGGTHDDGTVFSITVRSRGQQMWSPLGTGRRST